jgi:hypothetical protein
MATTYQPPIGLKNPATQFTLPLTPAPPIVNAFQMGPPNPMPLGGSVGTSIGYPV